MTPWKLFYDGGCNLCADSQLRVGKWAAKVHQPFEAVFLQSDEAVSKGYLGEEMILEADGEVFRGPEAWLKLLWIAPAPLRWLAGLCRFRWTHGVARLIYRLVARYRYVIFGRTTCEFPKARKS